jgi:hypothetical protein
MFGYIFACEAQPQFFRSKYHFALFYRAALPLVSPPAGQFFANFQNRFFII